MINDYLIQLKLLAGTLLFMFIVEPKAQPDPGDTPESVKETNIICYAALSKWVCASADEKEKAQEKAMRLASEQNEKNTNTSQAQVEIQTLEANNISQHVQEVETPIQSAIKDFIPRTDNSNKDTEDLEDSNQLSEAKQSSEPVIHPKDEANISLLQHSVDPIRSAAGEGDFNHWKSQYTEQWTFQVIGTSNRHHLDGFVLKHGLDHTNYSIVKTQANGADWWVVLSGLYSSREDALSHRDNLPSQLAAKAWVRQIKAIDGLAD